MLPRLAFRLIGAILTASSLSGLLAAQNFDMAGHDRRIVALGGLMRFHPGDDPTLAWLDLTSTTHHGLSSERRELVRARLSEARWFAWYRFDVTLPSYTGPVGAVDSDDRHELSGLCRRTTHRRERDDAAARPAALCAKTLFSPSRTIRRGSGRSLSIAIRVWHYPSELEQYGGIQEAMQLGDASLMTQCRRIEA